MRFACYVMKPKIRISSPLHGLKHSKICNSRLLLLCCPHAVFSYFLTYPAIYPTSSAYVCVLYTYVVLLCFDSDARLLKDHAVDIYTPTVYAYMD